MPFTYKIPIPAEISTGEVVLKEWLFTGGDYVNVGYGLAIVTHENKDYEIQANGQGIMHKHLAKEDSEIADKTQICLLAADGENIPYGKPYSLFQEITNE